MSYKTYILFVFLLFCALDRSSAQLYISEVSLLTLKSKNEKFYLNTIPYDNILQSTFGKTTVCTSDSTKVYEIARHFELSENLRELFLSNDGKTVVFIENYELQWEGKPNKNIIIYRNGKSVKEYALNELIECDYNLEDCCLFYNKSIAKVERIAGTRKVTYKENATQFEKQLAQQATYFVNDTLYIFTNSDKVITIDFNTLSLTLTPIHEIDPNKFNSFTPNKFLKKHFSAPASFEIPPLRGFKSLTQVIADSLGMAVFPSDKLSEEKYKEHTIKLELIIDKLGTAQVKKIESNDNINLNIIERIINTNQFETNAIPVEVDKWRFEGIIKLMNQDQKVAEQELLQEISKKTEEFKRRLTSDSINGIYIPKNIEECFSELNKILKPKEIARIKLLDSENLEADFDRDLGRWLRNNWGLWEVSRLRNYFEERKVYHPEIMSEKILDFYSDWLKGHDDKWKKFDKR